MLMFIPAWRMVFLLSRQHCCSSNLCDMSWKYLSNSILVNSCLQKLQKANSYSLDNISSCYNKETNHNCMYPRFEKINAQHVNLTFISSNCFLTIITTIISKLSFNKNGENKATLEKVENKL